MSQYFARVIQWLEIPFSWFNDLLQFSPVLTLIIIGSITFSFLYFLIKFIAKRV